ncbi:MAG: molybdopterin-synthase adenylyltransferase MoeB [Rhodospirillaceae bacterium]|mgnify:CR=1 FL=1|jgi:molybdopterin-synthase adenylyltransferase|nr:molybdopterin-synthase adenylyltransferase MoeB [Rhodospirillaceae bacterium]
MDITDFTEEQLHRYARHIVMPEVGGTGQVKLLNASVLLVGAGGLGAPLAMYLAAAGVGTLGIVDNDHVELSNLQRQVAHTTERVGMAKTESAEMTVMALNPDVTVIRHQERLEHHNALEIIGGYDVVCDGTDNFPTRYLINDACFMAGKPLVSAAMMRFDGQLTTFRAHEAAENPCYRCLFPEMPPEGLVPSCSEAGIFGAIAGVMGTLQAAEVLKEILGIGESLFGTLVIYDALATEFRRVGYGADPDCALCGSQATITDLSGHAAHAKTGQS